MLIFVFYLRRQISCTIPHLVEMQDSLYQAKFLINDYENWYKWRVPVPKHQNNKIFGKYLVKGVNRGPFMTWFSKVPQNSFKVIYRDQTTLETSTLPTICIFKRSNPTIEFIFQNSEIFISFVTSLSLYYLYSYIWCIEDERKI